MNIIILGAGRVGESVAESLVSEQNDITVIDQDPARLRLLEERLDLRGVVGNGIQPSVLREASTDAMKEMESTLNSTVQEANANLSDQAEPKTDDYASAILESAPDVTKVYRDALRQGRDSWGVKRTARPLWFKHSAGIRTRVQSGAARVKRFKRPALHK